LETQRNERRYVYCTTGNTSNKKIKKYWNAKENIYEGKRKSTPLLVDTDEENQVVEQNPRAKLTQVCEALDIDTDLLRFPSNGFTMESLEKSTGTKREKRIVREIV